MSEDELEQVYKIVDDFSAEQITRFTPNYYKRASRFSNEFEYSCGFGIE